MTKPIKSYTGWQPLEEVVVGRVYTPDYFDFVGDAQVRNQLQQILAETCEDLDNLQRTLELYGAKVLRPELPDRLDFINQQVDNIGVPIPPLTPRDWQITMGDNLLRLLPIDEMDIIFHDLELQDPNSVIDPHRDEFDATHVMNNAVASCIVRVGEDVFFDNSEWLTTEQMHWIRDNVLDSRYRVHRAVTNGHGDSVFAILKPGVILSTMHDKEINYQKDFPGWEVLKIWDASILAAMEIGKFKYENFNDRWYVPGVKPTDEFATFVDTYLTQWTGYVKETVFDVNCLVLDEQHVIFSAHNQQVFDYCKRHSITPIISELRHKYFFDGGISCCTQDIRRRGGLERYL